MPPPDLASRRLGSGPPLILINGLAGTSEDWDPGFIDGLAARNELHLIDNRGMGDSPDDGAPFVIADLAADYARVIEAEFSGPVSVLGWSMGGCIALVLALDHPEHLNHLVVLSAEPGGRDAELGDPAVLAPLIDLSPPPEEQARRLLALLFDDELARSLYPQVGHIVAAARARLSQDLLDRQRGALEAWHQEGVAERLGEISVPALIATGTADRVVPPANSLLMANRIPDSWLLRFRGGGHAFMAQYPATLSGIVNEFVAG